MFRVFSGSCLSLDDMSTVLRPNLVKRPHLLGPGEDFFTQDGQPVCPQPGAQTLQKVFSGSALDLNAMNGDYSEEESHSPVAPSRTLPVSTILSQLSSETEKEKTRAARNKTNVLVIGDSGYVLSHVVVKLLDAGYSVRAALPGRLNQQAQEDLYSVNRDSAPRLSIVEADATNSAALRDMMRGCKYVIHCGCSAAPSMRGMDAVKYHLQSIQALFDGIRLTGKSTVRRVIVTGSATSVFHVTDPSPDSGRFDESHWNTVVTAETEPVPYAKLVFEKEAWRLRKMLGVELVVLLPSILIGPSRSAETSEAMVILQALASAPWYIPFCPNLYWNVVDVRDLAEANVRALESAPVTDQRVIVSNECYSLTDISKVIKKLYPHLSPPTRTANTLLTLLVGVAQRDKESNLRSLWRNLGVCKRLDNRRAVDELGLQLTPLEETIGACVEQMIRAGELPAARQPFLATHRKLLSWTVAAGVCVTTAMIALRRKRSA